MGLISDTNNQYRPDKALSLEDDIDLSYLLRKISSNCNLSWAKEETIQEQHIIALKNITRLFKFVTVQEKKYEDRLSSYSNLYIIVQQFL